ncbi:MAG TPA: MBL fold metallo-hydrolase [Ktedonobacterales bacterium]|jgi:glyoxylase-like metal-dependent hydrolase (beta-lactamase superfamily II)
MSSPPDSLPTSPYFNLEQLAEGVWAAIVARGTGAWGNAGIVALGERMLVFDTFLTPAAARDLRSAAEALTGQQVAYVVNSHYHMDHIHGNAVFDDATIITTGKTRERIANRGAEILAWMREKPDDLASLDAEIVSAATPELADDLRVAQGDYRALYAALPELALRLPDITFEQRLTLHGSERAVNVLSYGGGHTSSDAFLFLPAERIAFLGDLLGVRMHPSFGQADLERWDEILERIEALDIQTVVPGHGSVGTLDDVAALRQYLGDMEMLVDEAIVRGETAERIVALPPPGAYAAWGARDIYTDNLRHLYSLLARSAEEE